MAPFAGSNSADATVINVIGLEFPDVFSTTAVDGRRENRRPQSSFLRSAAFALIVCPSLTAPGCGNHEAGVDIRPFGDSPLVVDLGVIPAGTDIHKSVPIRNRSNQRQIVDEVRPSCDCMRVSLSPRQLDPGQEAMLTIDTRAASVAGPFHASVKLLGHCGNAAWPFLVRFEGMKRRVMTFVDGQAITVRMQSTSPRRALLRVLNYSGRPWQDLHVESDQPWCVVLPPSNVDKSTVDGEATECWQIGLEIQRQNEAMVRTASAVVTISAGEESGRIVVTRVLDFAIRAIPPMLFVSNAVRGAAIRTAIRLEIGETMSVPRFDDLAIESRGSVQVRLLEARGEGPRSIVLDVELTGQGGGGRETGEIQVLQASKKQALPVTIPLELWTRD